MELRLPSISLYDAFRSMVEDYRQAGEDRYQEYRDVSREDFARYVRRLEDMSQGISLPVGYVPGDIMFIKLMKLPKSELIRIHEQFGGGDDVAYLQE